MCVSLDNAIFSNTIVSLSLADHPYDDGKVHVLGYMNSVSNLSHSDSANAMLLHFPSNTMSRKNIVDTTCCPHFLDDQEETLPKPRSRSSLGSREAAGASVEVFNHGIYTVVLANEAQLIPQALDQVSEDKRPEINQALFTWYAERFPGWSFALCCFNTRDEVRSNPMLWWYENNLFPDYMMIPAIDAHTGDVPDLNKKVNVGHTLILGRQDSGFPKQRVTYREKNRMTPIVKSLLPKYVTGIFLSEFLPNGDFIAPIEVLETGDLRALKRGILK